MSMSARQQGKRKFRFKYLFLTTQFCAACLLLALGEQYLYTTHPALLHLLAQLMFWLATATLIGAGASLFAAIKKYPHITLPKASSSDAFIGGRNMPADQVVGFFLPPFIAAMLLIFILHGQAGFAKLFAVSLKEFAVIYFSILGIRFALLLRRIGRTQIV
jgi:hypothetical protein